MRLSQLLYVVAVLLCFILGAIQVFRKRAPIRLATTTPGSTTHPIPKECERHDKIYSWLSQALENDLLGGWGDVLDAGAGIGSMCFLMRQSYRSITEVTAVKSGRYGQIGLQKVVESADAPPVSIVVGNWRNANILNHQKFDVVLADYLFGAAEQFWAYGADAMMDRVLDSVKVGGFVLIVGIEPYDVSLDKERGGQDAFVLEVEALGDAASLLAGHHSYRELPEDWVVRQLKRSKEFRIVTTKQFPMRLSERYIKSQASFAVDEAKDVTNTGLRRAIVAQANQLNSKANAFATSQPKAAARNYAIVAQRHNESL